MSFKYSVTTATCSQTTYNPLSDPKANPPSGNWTYWYYTYSGSGSAETISFKPDDFLNSSGEEDKDYYMCLISQGGSGGPPGASSYVDTYDGYTYNLTAYGGSGGGGAGGQVYTNSFSTNKNTVTVTLYPCGTYTPSQYEYKDSDGNNKTIKVAYGTSGGTGTNGVFYYDGDYDYKSELFKMSSVVAGSGGGGGYTSNTGSGGDDNTSTTIYRYGGSGGNGGCAGLFSTPAPVNNTPLVGLTYAIGSPGIAGDSIAYYGGFAYGGTNGSPGEQSGSTQGPVGSTTVSFADGTSAAIALGGLGGSVGNSNGVPGKAGNSSAFMFFYQS